MKKLLFFLLIPAIASGIDWVYREGSSFPSGGSFVTGALPIQSAITAGADLNGYVSEYECTLNGTQCDVDIDTYVACSCDATVDDSLTEAQIEFLINGGDDCVCVEAGDYRSKGTINITAVGTSGTRKVLKYYNASDSGADPWSQSVGDRARFGEIDIDGDYWIVHRISVDPLTALAALEVNGTNNILNRIYVYDGEAAGLLKFNSGSDNSTLQNSVIADTGIPFTNSDKHCINFQAVDDLFIVNNEIYNCAGDGIQRGNSSSNRNTSVLENNDFYLTTAYYSDGSGNLDPLGNEACAENAIDYKGDGATSGAGMARMYNNRMWGFKPTDTQCAGTGSNGNAIVLNEASSGSGTDNAYGDISANIIFDTEQGLVCANNSPSDYAINLNIFARFEQQGVNLSQCQDMEMYLNTFVGTGTRWLAIGGTSPNKDIRCNTVIDSTEVTGSISGGVQMSHNVYVGTNDSGETNNLQENLLTRANNTSYTANDIMRLNSDLDQCTTFTDSDCFLYQAQNSGTSAASQPSFCTSANCTTTDGAITWKSIAGPYQFYRKLRTSPELVVLPYARPYEDFPGITPYYCPSGFASRTGVGPNDKQP